MSHLFNETYGPEKEQDTRRAVDAKGMEPGVHPGRPGEMSGSWYRDPDIFMIPLILLIVTLGTIGLAVSDTPIHQEPGVLKSTGKMNINKYSSPDSPPVWDDIIEKDRASQVRQAEGRQNNSFMRQIRVLCNPAWRYEEAQYLH